MFSLCISLLKVNSSLRNDNQNRILRTMFSQLQFFKELRENNDLQVIVQLINAMKYQRLTQGQVLFKVGDKGTRFYVILKGMGWDCLG